MNEDTPIMPWVVVGPNGVIWLGHARGENQAWDFALGWPGKEEIQSHKDQGFYAAEATVTWNWTKK